jgi:hypothetical protein
LRAKEFPKFLDDSEVIVDGPLQSSGQLYCYCILQSTVLGLIALPSLLPLKFILSSEWTLYKYSRTVMKASEATINQTMERQVGMERSMVTDQTAGIQRCKLHRIERNNGNNHPNEGIEFH